MDVQSTDWYLGPLNSAILKNCVGLTEELDFSLCFGNDSRGTGGNLKNCKISLTL
jgi:hypothetical protein